MTVREDFCLTISENNFRDFDIGKEIRQQLPKNSKIRRGDIVVWQFQNFDGHARVGLCFQIGGYMICYFTKID